MALARTLFTPEHEQYRDALRRFLDKEVAPHHARWEEQQHVDREVWLKAAQAGFLCGTMPEAFGGAGGDFSAAGKQSMTDEPCDDGFQYSFECKSR